MHLPLLPLCPTAGTNDDEAGASQSPPPPSAAAAAAMREALSDGEHAIIKSILEQIATNVPGHAPAWEEACHDAWNFLVANGLQNAIDDDDAVWERLASKLFPNAPKPENTSELARQYPPFMPANKKEYFFEMCRRARNARLRKERYDALKQKMRENDEVITRLNNAIFMWGADVHPGLEYALIAAMPGYKRLQKKLARREWYARHLQWMLWAEEDGPLYEAKTKLSQWASAPRAPPRVRGRSVTVVQHDAYPESSSDDDDDPGEDEVKKMRAAFLDGGDDE